MGELVVFDPGKGRQEASGAIQRIPERGKPVEPVIRDALVNGSWPKFLHPYPLSDKYILVSCKLNSSAGWALCLVDTHDNILPILDQLLDAGVLAGRTVVMTTHDLARGLACCDEVAILSRGRVVFQSGRESVDPGGFPRLYADVVNQPHSVVAGLSDAGRANGIT